MKRNIVIYKSAYGHTKQYAQWIAEKLQCPIIEVSMVKESELEVFDTIIYGGGLYASGINGVTFVNRNMEVLQSKVIVVFSVGLASCDHPNIFIPVIEKNFTKEQQANIKFFHFRGGIDYKKLGFVHKSLMAMLKHMVQSKDNLSLEEEEMISTYGDVVDFSDRASIDPLIAFVNQ